MLELEGGPPVKGNVSRKGIVKTVTITIYKALVKRQVPYVCFGNILFLNHKPQHGRCRKQYIHVKSQAGMLPAEK